MATAFILAGCFAGGYLRGITGFGGVAILLVSLSFILDVHSAIAISLLVDLSSNAMLLPSAWSDCSKMRLRAMLLGTALGLPAGALVLVAADQTIVTLCIYATIVAICLVVLAGASIRTELSPRTLFRASLPVGAVLGATSISIPMALLLFSSNDSPKTSRKNFIVWAVFSNATMLAIVCFVGAVHVSELWRILYLAPVYLVGAALGKRSIGLLEEEGLRKVVLVALLGLSIAGSIATVGAL